MSIRVRDRVVAAFFRTALNLGGRLPLAMTRRVCASVVGTLLAVSGTNRRRMISHLQIAFPDARPEERDAIAHGCARHFGMVLAEVAWLWHAAADDVIRICDFNGREHIDTALAQERGVVLTTAHCGNWEMLAAVVSAVGYPLFIAARELDNRGVNDPINSLRMKFGAEVVFRGAKAGHRIVTALGRNWLAGLLIDQDIRKIPGVFVPFFGRQAWTPSGAAMIALRTGSPVVPLFIHRRRDGTHLVDVLPSLPIPTAGEFEDRVRELTASATACIEAQIRAHPEQWVWMHRRWRTQEG